MNELSEIVRIIGPFYKFQLKEKSSQIEITITDRKSSIAVAQILPIDHFDERAVNCVHFCIAKIEEKNKQKLDDQFSKPVF